MITRLVSGGQTGADRAALDAARELGIETGGWVPRGRWAEDGQVPDCYPNMKETDSADPALRTEHNVRDSDGTVVFSHGERITARRKRHSWRSGSRVSRAVAIVALRVETQQGKQCCGIRVRRCDPDFLCMGELLHRMLGAKRNPTIVESDTVKQFERPLAAQRLRGARAAAFVLGDAARDIGGDSGVDGAVPGA